MECWQGFIFVNFTTDAESLTARLGPVDELVANWNLEAMATEEPTLQADMPWNWKIMHENSIDVYHVDRLHYPRHAVLPSRGYLPIEIETEDSAVVASLPAFEAVKAWVLNIEGGPLVSLATATNILAALTGSASGGMTIALDALGPQVPAA